MIQHSKHNTLKCSPESAFQLVTEDLGNLPDVISKNAASKRAKDQGIFLIYIRRMQHCRDPVFHGKLAKVVRHLLIGLCRLLIRRSTGNNGGFRLHAALPEWDIRCIEHVG